MKRDKTNRHYAKRGVSPPKKVSEMVWEFAGEFIRLADTTEQKQNHLNAACSAWNIACRPIELRSKLVDRYVNEYKRHNPLADEKHLCDIRRDMEKLIQNKLRLFPGVIKQIVNARIECVGDEDRIEVLSLRFE